MANSVDPDQTAPIASMANSVDPDQEQSIGAVCSGSMLFLYLICRSAVAQW